MISGCRIPLELCISYATNSNGLSEGDVEVVGLRLAAEAVGEIGLFSFFLLESLEVSGCEKGASLVNFSLFKQSFKFSIYFLISIISELVSRSNV